LVAVVDLGSVEAIAVTVTRLLQFRDLDPPCNLRPIDACLSFVEDRLAPLKGGEIARQGANDAEHQGADHSSTLCSHNFSIVWHRNRQQL
jgi:hypothetical protein